MGRLWRPVHQRALGLDAKPLRGLFDYALRLAFAEPASAAAGGAAVSATAEAAAAAAVWRDLKLRD
eukprot:7036755-Alexandrium_andersonii.AAC.1